MLKIEVVGAVRTEVVVVLLGGIMISSSGLGNFGQFLELMIGQCVQEIGGFPPGKPQSRHTVALKMVDPLQLYCQ